MCRLFVQVSPFFAWGRVQKFGWQGDADDDELQPFPERSFTFDRSEYEQLLRDLREHYKRRALMPQPTRNLLRCSASDPPPIGQHSGQEVPGPSKREARLTFPKRDGSKASIGAVDLSGPTLDRTWQCRDRSQPKCRP